MNELIKRWYVRGDERCAQELEAALAANIPGKVDAVLIEMRRFRDIVYPAATVKLWADRIESALASRAEPFAWYAPSIDDTCTHAKKVQRERDLPETARLFTVPLYAHAPPAVPVESLGRDVEPDEVAEYVEDYEYRGETEDGRDACYTPNERERLLIEDAIRGWEYRTTGTAPPPASVPDHRVADLLHLLQFATITTPTETDADQAQKIMRELRASRATTPETAPPTHQEGSAP